MKIVLKSFYCYCGNFRDIIPELDDNMKNLYILTS